MDILWAKEYLPAIGHRPTRNLVALAKGVYIIDGKKVVVE